MTDKAKITFVGDLLCYNQYIRKAHIPQTNKYDFTSEIHKVKPHFSKEITDYVIANLETPLETHTNKEFQLSKKGFNAPPEFLEAWIDAGVDLFLTGNNHSYDQGENGLLSTLDILDSYGVDHIGTARIPQDTEKIFIKEIKGIKFAFLTYTFGINSYVHGRLLPKDKKYQIKFLAPLEYHPLEFIWNLVPSFLNFPIPNSIFKLFSGFDKTYSYRDLTESIKANIAKAKELGADLVVLMPHFGIECTDKPLRFVRKWVENMFASGADIILGGHTHSLQPMEFWTLPEKSPHLKLHAENEHQTTDSRKGLVIYSIGNFISHAVNYCPNKRSTRSIILNITCTKDETGTRITSASCIPTCIESNHENDDVRVVPLPDEILNSKNTRNNTRLEELKNIAAQVHASITGYHPKTDNDLWVFNPDKDLQHKDRWIYTEDFSYLIHGFPLRLFSIVYDKFVPEVVKTTIHNLGETESPNK